MILLFDIGNTRIKWARFVPAREPKPQPVRLLDVGAESHIRHTFDEIAALYWSDWPPPDQIMVSAVTPDQHWQQLQSWCRRRWQRSPVRVVSMTQGFGIRNAYVRAEELGSDRWAAMVGAHHLQQGATCIIDAGTAITVDFLDSSGQHLGGYIIPGLQLMQQSLVQGTHAIQLSAGSVLADTEFSAGPDINLAPGTSTAKCIEHGLIMAATALIEVSCKNMELRTGKSFQRLLTGGHAGLLASFTGADPDVRVQLEPNLVLLGLAQMAAEH